MKSKTRVMMLALLLVPALGSAAQENAPAAAAPSVIRPPEIQAKREAFRRRHAEERKAFEAGLKGKTPEEQKVLRQEFKAKRKDERKAFHQAMKAEKKAARQQMRREMHQVKKEEKPNN